MQTHNPLDPRRGNRTCAQRRANTQSQPSVPAQTQLAPPNCIPAGQVPQQNPVKGRFHLPKIIRDRLPKVCDKFGVCVDPTTSVPIGGSSKPKPPCPVTPPPQTQLSQPPLPTGQAVASTPKQ